MKFFAKRHFDAKLISLVVFNTIWIQHFKKKRNLHLLSSKVIVEKGVYSAVTLCICQALNFCINQNTKEFLASSGPITSKVHAGQGVDL